MAASVLHLGIALRRNVLYVQIAGCLVFGVSHLLLSHISPKHVLVVVLGEVVAVVDVKHRAKEVHLATDDKVLRRVHFHYRGLVGLEEHRGAVGSQPQTEAHQSVDGGTANDGRVQDFCRGANGQF